jgi:predicted transcriptional regulator
MTLLTCKGERENNYENERSLDGSPRKGWQSVERGVVLEQNGRDWKFLTNHALVLLCIAQDPNARVRDIADRVGITERAAHRLVGDLVEGGYVSVQKMGRRNCYEVHPEVHLRLPLNPKQEIGTLLKVITQT